MTASVPSSVPLTRFGRRQTKGFLLGYSLPVVLAVASGLIVLALVVFSGGGAALLYSAPVWGALIASGFVRWQGAPVVEAIPMVVHWRVRQATGQTKYRVKPMKPRPAGTMGLPGDAAALRFHEDVETGAVMVHDPHRGTLAAVVSVSHPAFVLLDASDQAQRVQGWSRVLAGLASTGTIAAIQVLEQVIPDPGRGVAGWWRDQGVHDDSWVSRNYAELMAQAAPTASTHRTLITLVLDLGKAARQIRQAGRGLKGAARVLAGDMSNLTVSLRAAGLHVDGWLSAPELATVVRQAFDPSLALADDEPGADLAAGPAAVDEHWDFVRHDAGFSAVMWISEWPTADSTPSFLHSLIFAQNVRRSLSLVAVPLPAAEAMREIRKEKTDYITDREQKARTGRIIAQSDDQEYVDVLDRERAMISGHADMRFSGFLTVTAESVDELRAAVSHVQRSATQCMLETRVLYGRQAQAFIVSALPLGRTV